MIALLGGHACAAEQDVIQQQAETIGVEELERIAGTYAPEIEWSTEQDFENGLAEVFAAGAEVTGGVLKEALRSGMLLLIIVLIAGIAEGAAECGAKHVIQAVPIAASLAITSVSIADTNSLIGLGQETISKIEAFSKVLFPTVAAAMAASGSPGAAAARQAAAVLFSDILVSLINHFLLPIVYGYIAASVVSAVTGNEGVKRIAAMLKWLVTTILTLVLLAFVGYLTVSGVIAGKADALTIKATKFAVSGMVPVVGGILSDATETILAGAGILKNSIGVFGMLVVLSMCVVPFLQLAVHYLVYKLVAVLSSVIGNSRVVGLIDGIGGAFGLVLGMTGASALVLLISMVSAILVTNT